MQILKERKKREVSEIFKTQDEFITYLSEINDKINFSNQTMINKINNIYNIMLTDEGVIQWNRFDRWLPSKFGFKKSNLLKLEFWLERGWTSDEGRRKISLITSERANKAIKTKSDKKKEIIFNNLETIKFNGVVFTSADIPKCGKCKNNLELTKINICNKNDEYYYKIIKCSNLNCGTHKEKTRDLYRSFLPHDIGEKKIKDVRENIKSSSVLSIDSWLKNGYSVDEANKNISDIQSNKSLLVKNRFIVSKENLKVNGYSESEIKDICKTPTQIEFWVDKGYNEAEAKEKVRDNQLNAIKYIDYDKRLLPSNLEYWINLGFTYEQSKEKIKERQTTFSLDICIQKYGEINGLNKFNERQIKWLTNYKRSNFSKISQELFWGVLNKEFIDGELYFATYNNGSNDESGKNNEYRLRLDNGVILPDFFLKNKKRIIEFDGTYYHRNTPENNLREDKRDKMIIESGYDVLHINESDYKKNKQEMINKCIEFLNKK